MHRPRPFALTVLSAAALAALLVAPAAHGPDLLPAAEAQQKATPEDLVVEFTKAHDKALNDSANEYEKLYKWCWDKKLAYTAIGVRRLVLRYQPDHEEVRKFVGYGKTPDGFWIKNEARRDQIRDEADIEDPKAQKYPEKRLAVDKRVRGIWSALANKAKSNGEKLDPANAAAWKERAGKCWERVLEIDPTAEDAHKGLEHPKFAGKYVRPEAIPFLKVRQERKDGGGKRAKLAFPTQQVEPDGIFQAAGLTGGGAKSEHFLINTVHGKDVAARLAVWAERALIDYVEVYGAPEDIKQRLPITRYDVVKEQGEFIRLLKSAGWEDARIQEFVKYFGGTGLVPGQRASTCSAGADADDHVIHFTARACANAVRNIAIQELGSPIGGIEDWLESSISYDLTRRLTGTTLTVVGDFGKYGTDLTPRMDRDIWVELARMFVANDDDVDLKDLVKRKYSDQNIRVPEIVKGYALLQYLFESDVEKARKFIYTAVAQGTPQAVEAVYGVSMDELDKSYRNWILKSW